jgi:hypothetical protein
MRIISLPECNLIWRLPSGEVAQPVDCETKKSASDKKATMRNTFISWAEL